MESLSDAALEKLLAELESDLAERKQSWSGDAAEKATQAICAFANDLPDHRKAGVLFVGVTDDGRPSNLEIDDKLLLTLASIRDSGNIVPPPMLIVEKRKLKGVFVAVVCVAPADAPPVRYKGRIWIRVGPRRAVASAQEERVLNERRRHRDLPFDVCPLPSSSIGDLSRALFEGEYLLNAFAPDVLLANERTYEERLAACRMLVSADDPRPTVLGMLTIGVSPREWLPCDYIQFLRIRGLEWSDPIVDEEVIDGSLATLLRRIDDKLRAHLSTQVDISPDVEVRSAAYPLTALQQLIRNAVMHRTYEHTNTPVRVYWFDDRIEIHSPGGPFGIVNASNFGRSGATDYRNPHIAEAIKVLGFVQRFGVGIATARKSLATNGNPPPDFTVEDSAVLATLRVRQ